MKKNDKREKMLEAGYFAIIPANIRYHQTLTPNAKLCYGEITALTKRWGYCIANNNHFAELYGVSSKSVGRWIGQMRNEGFIDLVLINNFDRRIYLAGALNMDELQKEFDGWDINEVGGVIKLLQGVGQKCGGGLDKNEDYKSKPKNKPKKKAESGGKPHLSQQQVLDVYEYSKGLFSEIYEKIAGSQLRKGFFGGKEGRNLKRLNDLIYDGLVSECGGEEMVSTGGWCGGILFFLKGVKNMSDDWYRANAFTPSGLLTHYETIILKLKANKNGTGKNAKGKQVAGGQGGFESLL